MTDDAMRERAKAEWKRRFDLVHFERGTEFAFVEGVRFGAGEARRRNGCDCEVHRYIGRPADDTIDFRNFPSKRAEEAWAKDREQGFATQKDSYVLGYERGAAEARKEPDKYYSFETALADARRPLVEALKKYGQHATSRCYRYENELVDGDCPCGLDAALRAAGEGEK